MAWHDHQYAPVLFIAAQPSHGHDDPFPKFFFFALTSRFTSMPFWMLQYFRLTMTVYPLEAPQQQDYRLYVPISTAVYR